MNRLLIALAIGTSCLTPSLLLNCTSQPRVQSIESGKLQLALTGTSTAGLHYRLRNASFDINGDAALVVSTETDPDAETAQIDLKPGNYTVELVDGWFLERLAPDGTFERVAAVLSTAKTREFAIEESKSTNVRFGFSVTGDQVELGDGTLVLGIDVADDTVPGDAGIDCGAGYHRLSDGKCGRIIFSDNFDDGIWSPDWQPWMRTFVEADGRVSIGNGPRPGFNYGHSGNGRGGYLATHVGDPAWTNYRIDLDAEVLPAGTFNPSGLPSCLRVFEMALRVEQGTENWNAPASTAYSLGVIPSYDGCMGRQPGGVTLTGVHGVYMAGTGCCDIAAGSFRSLVSTTSPAFVEGANHYAVELKGNNIKFWVNEQSVFDYTDDTVPYLNGAHPITFGGFTVGVTWELLGWIDNVVVTDMN